MVHPPPIKEAMMTKSPPTTLSLDGYFSLLEASRKAEIAYHTGKTSRSKTTVPTDWRRYAGIFPNSLTDIRPIWEPISNPCTEVPSPTISVGEQLHALIVEHGMEGVLKGLVWALKQMKDPEQYVFQLYLFARRALKEISTK